MTKLSIQEQAIHNQFTLCGKNAKDWMNKCVLMLPEIARRDIWRKKGFKDIYDYARQIAGMSPYKVREALRVLKKIEDKPALKIVAEKKGIWAVKPTVNVATISTDEFWANKAISMNQQTLKTYIRDLKTESLGGAPGHISEDGLQRAIPQNESRCPILPRKTVTMKLDQTLLNELIKIKGTGDWNSLILELLAAKKRETDREKNELEQEKPDKIKSNRHKAPAAILNFVRQRSKGICEHKNCIKPADEFHHTIPYALSKEHNPDHIRHLCKAHHEISHHGLIENQNQEPRAWQTKDHPDYYDINNLINARVQEHRANFGNPGKTPFRGQPPDS